MPGGLTARAQADMGLQRTVPDGNDEIMSDKEVRLAKLDTLRLTTKVGCPEHDEGQFSYCSSFGRWWAVWASSMAK